MLKEIEELLPILDSHRVDLVRGINLIENLLVVVLFNTLSFVGRQRVEILGFRRQFEYGWDLVVAPVFQKSRDLDVQIPGTNPCALPVNDGGDRIGAVGVWRHEDVPMVEIRMPEG